jgi:zinc protease
MRRTTLAALVWFLAAPAWAAGPTVVRQTLSNGARLQISEQAAVPMVIVDALVDAGSRLDPPGEEGLANLTADLLTEGTATRSAEQIHETADFIGASLQSQAGDDFAFLNLRVLRKDLETGLDLWADSLVHPSFPNAEVERRKTAVLGAIRASDDNPSTVADRAFEKALFGAAPYGHPSEGWAESVQKLKRQEIVDFYQRSYQPSRTIITVVGDVKAAEVIAALEKRLAAWHDGAHRGPASPSPAAPPPAASTVVIDKPLTQANIVLGHRGVSRDNPDWYALTVMNYILGGGSFSSRLFDSVRTKGGLAYSVASSFTGNKDPGSFKVAMQTKSTSAQEAIAKVHEEVDRMRDAPVSDQELDDAKKYLTGSFPMRLDSNAKVTGLLAQIEFYGLGNGYFDEYLERTRAVTKEDVQRVARQYLHPDEFVLVVVGSSEQTGIRQ